MYDLQNDRRPDRCFAVWVWMWNVGGLGGMWYVFKELSKRMTDVCLQEVRWREQGCRMLGMDEGRFELWSFENGDGVGGVGAMVSCVSRWWK